MVTLDSDARPALLASFIGLDASGSWTLTITGVPEPSEALLGGLGALLLLRRRW